MNIRYHLKYYLTVQDAKFHQGSIYRKVFKKLIWEHVPNFVASFDSGTVK